MARTVLVVDDDPHIRQLLVFALEKAGLGVREAGDGEAALAALAKDPADLVILDINMPKLDGLEVCRRLRAQGDLPILFLSSRDDEIDRVLGIELGGDDYVVKPFSPRELVARVRAVLRRGAPAPAAPPAVIEIGASVDVDLARREALVRGEPVALATREFDLLAHLARNQGVALARRQLLDAVWGEDWDGDERTVDVHVAQLRKKLGDDLPLATVWGVGYRLG